MALSQIVLRPDSPRGTHFRRAGPRQRVVFDSDDVVACIVTCGGLCPGLNTVIREIVCGLSYMYGVKKILGIDVRSPQSFIIALRFFKTQCIYKILRTMWFAGRLQRLLCKEHDRFGPENSE